MATDDLRVEYEDLDMLARAPRNPKQHDLGVLQASLDRFGFVAPILVDDATGQLVAGHGRLEALQQLKAAGTPAPDRVRVDGDRWLVPVIRGVAFASAREAESYLIADNQTTIVGGWDSKRLAEILAELAAEHALGGTGFSPVDVDAMLREIATTTGRTDPPAPSEDMAAELVAKWGTRRGQLWQAGTHRILCGDAWNRADIMRLLGGRPMDLIVTSPPYNQGIEAFRPSGMHREGDWVAKVGRLAYADTLPETEYQKRQRTMIGLWYRFVRDGGSMFYNHKNRYRDKRVVSPLEWLPKPFVLRQEIVWSRPGSVTQNARMFLPSDERIYWLYKGKDFTFNDTTEIKTYSTVWDIALETNKDHAVGFPVELPRRCLAACSEIGEAVADPFLGSGTTLVAAEQLGRHGHGLEIEPKNVALALERLAGMGLTPRPIDG
jgi:DNA modification methylase